MKKDNCWFITFSGAKYFFKHPRLKDIQIVDIAHALALVNRFGGHTTVPYSVGQHSLYVTRLLEIMVPGDYLLHLHGLLHDASEYVLGDLVRPLKHSLPSYRKLEKLTQERILKKLGVPALPKNLHPLVKIADNRVLLSEREAIIKVCPHKWQLTEEPAPFKIRPCSWKKNEQEFLERFWALKASI